MAAVAFLAFGRYSWLLYHYQKFESRRRLMGCEMARQVLDFAGHPQLSVKQLELPAEHYEGTTLYALAASTRQAVITARSFTVWHQFRRVLTWLILPAWIALFLKIEAAYFILGVVFVLGIFDFIRDWEWQSEILEFLKKTGCFEPDEMIKLKRLLQALQVEGLAQIIKGPYELIAGWISKRKN